ncbi:MAG: HlyD family efflux transporter periplasmic adaptor subunit [Chloroflexi bacterium]|nr:HlyD family efflux transporter periplasmic adaptor subunit [Chloroflexota bacterium]
MMGTHPQSKIQNPKSKIVRPVLGLVVLAALAWGGVEIWRAAQPPGPLAASGTVEADEVLLGSEVGGRLVALRVEEGRSVSEGDVVARLDDGLLQLQLRQVDAAARAQLELQADKYLIRSPTSGVATRVLARAGEVVSPGQTIATVADLSRLKLTVYVLERDLGQVRVGQRVSITADPFPGRTFAGTVTSINTRAEFTPRNVQTQRDRLNLVFGIKLRVDNPEGALKPGMPLDAAFTPGF